MEEMRLWWRRSLQESSYVRSMVGFHTDGFEKKQCAI